MTRNRNVVSANVQTDELRPSRLRWLRRGLLMLLGLAVVPLLVWSGCKQAPVTGRRQLLVVPESQEVSMGAKAFQDVVAKEKPSANTRWIALVERVGRRIAAVAERPDYQWEFRGMASSQQNAFALPGGKVAIYEGILPVCQSEAGLAVVMSHEVAHALARHGGERMSQQMAAAGVQKAIEFGTKDRSDEQRKLILTAYGMGSQYGVLLPYSRKQEAEADHIGLMLMAKAGYDPSEAPQFWERFSASHQGRKPPEFLSTHPSDARRAATLRSLLPAAMEIYRQAATKHGLGESVAVATRQQRNNHPARQPRAGSQPVVGELQNRVVSQD